MTNPISSFTQPPSLDDFESAATSVFESIPAALRDHIDNVVMRIEDFPDEEICSDMELDSPFDLLGLYHGVDLTRKSVADPSPYPDTVFLFRRPILDYWCESGEDLTFLIRHVLIHEIGHHFGFSDEDMERLEREAE